MTHSEKFLKEIFESIKKLYQEFEAVIILIIGFLHHFEFYLYQK